jgi:hypothetical protein
MTRSSLGPRLAQEVGTPMQFVCQKRPAFVKNDGKKIRAEIEPAPTLPDQSQDTATAP